MVEKRCFFACFALVLFSFFAKAQEVLFAFDTTSLGLKLPKQATENDTEHYIVYSIPDEYEFIDRKDSTGRDSFVEINTLKLVTYQNEVLERVLDSTVFRKRDPMWILKKGVTISANIELTAPKYATSYEKMPQSRRQILLIKQRDNGAEDGEYSTRLFAKEQSAKNMMKILGY